MTLKLTSSFTAGNSINISAQGRRIGCRRMIISRCGRTSPARRYCCAVTKVSFQIRKQPVVLTHFRQAQLVTIAEAGLWLHHDKLEEVLGVLRRFLGV